MELAIIGVVGQIIALRVLIVQAASRPDDPPLVRQRVLAEADRARRRQAIADRTLWAAIAFCAATVLAVVGIVLMIISW